MSLKIVGAGYGRTGTNSLKLALEQLGFGPCHHMFEVRDNFEEQVVYWEDALAGKQMDWDKVYAGFQSQVDWPGAHYWREVAAHFPDAKVLLSVREPNGWFDSFTKTIGDYMNKRGEHGDEQRNRTSKFVYQMIGEETFDNKYNDREYMVQKFNDHIAVVQAAIPADRLLTFDVREGWEPLCAFLGVGVPDTPFPRSNSSKEFKERVAAGPET